MTGAFAGWPQVQKVLSDKRAYFTVFGAIGGITCGSLCTALYGVLPINTDSTGGALSTWVVGGGFNGMAIAALLTFGQSRYVGRSFDKSGIVKALICAGAGSAAGGFVASRIGFPLAAAFGGTTDAGRFIGWIILGMVVGYVVSKVIPNLRPVTAAAAGAIGGFVGCGLMYLLGSLVAGTATTGAATGAALAFAETAFPEAWLEVTYGQGEIRTVSLGREPVSVGSGANCTVYAANVPATACRFLLENGTILFEDLAAGGTRRQMQPGEIISIGRLKLRVRGARTAPAQTTVSAP